MKRNITIRIAGVFMLVYSCGSFIKEESGLNNKLRGVKLIQNFPIVDTNGKLMRYDTSTVNIYYFGNQIMYNNYYRWDNYVQNVLTESETRQNFFIYTIGAKSGHFLDKNISPHFQSISVDSMLNSQWYIRASYSGLFSLCYLTPLSVNYNKDSSLISKSYTFKGKSDSTVSGKCIFGYSSNLYGISFTIAKEIDTLNKMKLCRLNVTNDSRYIKESKVTLDRIDDIFEMEELVIDNKEEILKYFQANKDL